MKATQQREKTHRQLHLHRQKGKEGWACDNQLASGKEKGKGISKILLPREKK